MSSEQKIRESLRALITDGGRISIEPPAGRRLTVVIVSPLFEGMDEAARQELAWGKMLAALEPADVASVDTIFTMTAAEYESAA